MVSVGTIFYRMYGKILKSSLLLAVLAVSQAVAQMPPERFDHTYTGEMQSHLVPYGQAWAMCDKLAKSLGEEGWPVTSKQIQGRHLYGCSMLVDDVCIIVHSWSLHDKDMKSNVYRHERAHCNGWPADHPK